MLVFSETMSVYNYVERVGVTQYIDIFNISWQFIFSNKFFKSSKLLTKKLTKRWL